jgi:hypothetical protein
MKKVLYKLLPFIILLVFFFYWVTNICVTLSTNTSQKNIGYSFPLLIKLSGASWRLFAPPFTYNDRMYLILRDKKTFQITDSFEILGDIASEKRIHAPFNQHENIIDHLVNHAVGNAKMTFMQYREQLKKNSPGKTDSFYNAMAASETINAINGAQQIRTLSNYCKWLIAKKNIDTVGKEWKIALSEEKMAPFAERNNDGSIPIAKPYFETPYTSFVK